MPIRISRNGRAARLVEQGNHQNEAGNDASAQALYLQAAEVQPRWAVPWFNLGLLHKYRGEWPQSLDANLAALARDPGHEGAIWNAAIAATALGQWRQARGLWRRYGIDMPDSDEPTAFSPALTPIRVAPNGSPEVIWADRIDPARAVIRSVPTVASGRRYGDLLLHDGAPNGYRRLNGHETPVFDELQVLTPSRYATWELQVQHIDSEQADALVQRLGDADLPAENWSTGLRAMCKACSEGRPDDDAAHDHEAVDDRATDTVTLGLAMHQHDTDAARVQMQVRALIGDLPQAVITRWECVLPVDEVGVRA